MFHGRANATNIFGLVRGKLPLGLPMLCALTLAACGMRERGAAVPIQGPVETRHPIHVAEGVVYMEMDTYPGAERENLFRKRTIAAFLSDYRGQGGDVLTVRVPVRAENKAAVHRILKEVRAEIARQGLAPVEYKTYEAGIDMLEGAPVVLTYRGVKASLSRPCGGWVELGSDSADRSFYKLQRRMAADFGCASQSNLAAIVANPMDLEQPRDQDPSSGARRYMVYKNYIEGERTVSNTSLKGGKLSGIGE